MAVCKGCGADAGLLSEYCSKCAHDRWVTPPDDAASKSELRPDGLAPPSDRLAPAPASATYWRGSTELCILLGLACLFAGGYFLINPTVAVPSYAGIGTDQVVNFQKLVMGATLSLVGAIFLAAGIRPR